MKETQDTAENQVSATALVYCNSHPQRNQHASCYKRFDSLTIISCEFAGNFCPRQQRANDSWIRKHILLGFSCYWNKRLVSVINVENWKPSLFDPICLFRGSVDCRIFGAIYWRFDPCKSISVHHLNKAPGSYCFDWLLALQEVSQVFLSLATALSRQQKPGIFTRSKRNFVCSCFHSKG